MNSIYDNNGNRKYLTAQERREFLKAAKQERPEIYTFCLTLAYTGARISEVLALTTDRIDFSDQLIIIESLKKRQRGVFRAVPVPKEFLEQLDAEHGLKQAREGKRIWPWCRTTAWKHVKRNMGKAGVHGVHASPKGLRHSLGVIALQNGVPINMVKKWLGHSRLETTAIYADAVGSEERGIAKLFWDGISDHGEAS